MRILVHSLALWVAIAGAAHLAHAQSKPDYAAAKRQNTAQFTAFFHAMLAEGVYLPPSAFEAWFVSDAHDAAAVDRIAAALPVAAKAAARV